jgi:hypothetical protein
LWLSRLEERCVGAESGKMGTKGSDNAAIDCGVVIKGRRIHIYLV